MDTVIVTYKRSYLLGQLLLRIAIGIVLLVALVFLVVEEVWAVEGIFFLALFFILNSMQLKRYALHLKNKLPALLVSEEGFVDYTSPYQIGIVSWEEVQKVEQQWNFMLFPRVARLQVKNAKVLLRREQRLSRRFQMLLSLLVYGTPYIWELRKFAASKEEVIRLLKGAKDGAYNFNDLGEHLIEQ
jgi:hypothetical protein